MGQALRVFRITGERRQLVDKLNALRKSTYGKLAKLPHEPKERHLPGDFADRFFLHDTTKGKATIGKVRKQITALEQELEHRSCAVLLSFGLASDVVRRSDFICRLDRAICPSNTQT